METILEMTEMLIKEGLDMSYEGSQEEECFNKSIEEIIKARRDICSNIVYMENEIKKLIEIIDYFTEMTDPDGICENGCSCGECENCIEYYGALLDFDKIKEKYKPA